MKKYAAKSVGNAKSLVNEFKEFILRGNVVELAVAVVIGAAFTTVVNAFVKSLITPLIAAIGGQPDFSALSFTINNSRFTYGEFLNEFISFTIIAVVIFFFVVRPLNALMERINKRPVEADPLTKDCAECLSTIPYRASRCRHCTSPQKVA